MNKFNEIIKGLEIQPDHSLVYETEATCIYTNKLTLYITNENIRFVYIDKDEELVNVNEIEYVNNVLKDLFESINE